MTCCSGKVCPPINWNIDLDDTKGKSTEKHTLFKSRGKI